MLYLSQENWLFIYPFQIYLYKFVGFSDYDIFVETSEGLPRSVYLSFYNICKFVGFSDNNIFIETTEGHSRSVCRKPSDK